MNQTLYNRDGQISIGLIAIVVGGIVISVMAGVALKGGVNAVQKANVSKQNSVGCSGLDPEQCAAEELKKNQEAEAAKKAAENPIVGADEQLKDAVAGTPAVTETTPDPTLKEIGLSPIGGIPERLPSQSAQGLLSWINSPIIQAPWNALNFIVRGVMSGAELAYNDVKSAYNDFGDYYFSRTPLPIEPINLASVPNDSQSTPAAAQSGDKTGAGTTGSSAGGGGGSSGGGGTTETSKPKPVTSGGGSSDKAPTYCFSSETFKQKLDTYLSKIRIYETKKRVSSSFKVITDSNLLAYETAAQELSDALSGAYAAFESAASAYEEALTACKSPALPANQETQTCVSNYETKISLCNDGDGKCVVETTKSLAEQCFNYVQS